MAAKPKSPKKRDTRIIAFILDGVKYTYVKWKGDYNRTHHGVKFEDAAKIFKAPDTFFWDDVEHSTEEQKRAIAFGSTGLGQVVYVVHIQHTPDHTHLISAREAEPDEEVDFYERVYGKGNRDRGTKGTI